MLGFGTVVGLHIGTKQVRVVELKRTLGGVRLMGCGEAEIYPKDIKPEEVKAEDMIVAAIKSALAKAKIKTERVITALPEGSAMIRFFEMLRIPKKEWNPGIKYEARRYLPFKVDEVITDFQTTKTADTRKMGIVFVATKGELIKNYIFTLRQAGLRPEVIEAIPFSIMRALGSSEELGRKETTIAIDVSLGTANINIIRHGVPYITRDVSLIREVEEWVDDESAKAILTKGIPSADDKATVSRNLLNEVRLSLSYYKKQFPEEKVDRVILCGENSVLEGLRELLSKELGIPVKIANPMKSIYDPNHLIPSTTSSAFSIAIGLALRGFRPFLEMNLHAEERFKAEQKRKLITIAQVEATVALLLLVVFHLSMRADVISARKELEREIERGPRLGPVMDTMTRGELEEVKGDLEGRLSALYTLMADRVYWTTKLNELVRVLPEKTWLTDISLEEDRARDGRVVVRSMTLKGAAFLANREREVELVNEFMREVENNPPFLEGLGGVKLLPTQQRRLGKLGVTVFTIKLGEQ